MRTTIERAFQQAEEKLKAQPETKSEIRLKNPSFNAKTERQSFPVPEAKAFLQFVLDEEKTIAWVLVPFRFAPVLELLEMLADYEGVHPVLILKQAFLDYLEKRISRLKVCSKLGQYTGNRLKAFLLLEKLYTEHLKEFFDPHAFSDETFLIFAEDKKKAEEAFKKLLPSYHIVYQLKAGNYAHFLKRPKDRRFWEKIGEHLDFLLNRTALWQNPQTLKQAI